MINGETHSVRTLYILYNDNRRFENFFIMSNLQIMLGTTQWFEPNYQYNINKLI